MSASVTPAGSALGGRHGREFMTPEFVALKFASRHCKPPFTVQASFVFCHSPFSSNMVFAVTLRDGLPWKEKPPSTVDCHPASAAYVKLFGSETSKSEADQRRFATAAEIEREIGDIDAVDERLQAHRTVPLGDRTPGGRRDLEGSEKRCSKSRFSCWNVEVNWSTRPSERTSMPSNVGGFHRALVIESDVAHRHHGLAAVVDAASEREAEDVVVAAFLLVSGDRGHPATRRGVVVRHPLQGHSAAGALGVLLGIHVARQARQECAAARNVRQIGATQVVHRVDTPRCAGARIVGAAQRGSRAAVADRHGLGSVAVQPIGVQNGRQVRAGAGAGVRSLALVLAERMSTAE